MICRRTSEGQARQYIAALKEHRVGIHSGALHLELALLEHDSGGLACHRGYSATTHLLVTPFPFAWRQLRHVQVQRKVCMRTGHTVDACAIVLAALRAGEQPRDKLQQVLQQLEAAKVANHQPRQTGGLHRTSGHPPPLLSSTPATAQVAMLRVLLRCMLWSTSSRRRWDFESQILVTESFYAP